MASLILHQIIGELYCKKNNIKDTKQLLSGNIAPDTLAGNKDLNHYTGDRYYTLYIDAIRGRVNLSNFCKNRTINTDYDKGYFLHLVTDYIFYERLIISNISFADFIVSNHIESGQKMYKEYGRIAHFICKKYPKIDISQLPKFATTLLNEPLSLFTKDQISKFLEICSSLNLEDIYSDILKNNYKCLNKIDFN